MSFSDSPVGSMELGPREGSGQQAPSAWDSDPPSFRGGRLPDSYLLFEITPNKRSDLQTSLKSLQASERRGVFEQSPFANSQNKRLDFSPNNQLFTNAKAISSADRDGQIDEFFQQTHCKIETENFPDLKSATRRLWPTKRLPVVGCNCRNSKCLKNYCECLRKGELCNGCNCVGCENHSDSKLLPDRIKKIQKRALAPPEDSGCNCRQSRCLKNYCECHRLGARCGLQCKCFDCANGLTIRRR